MLENSKLMYFSDLADKIIYFIQTYIETDNFKALLLFIMMIFSLQRIKTQHL